MGAFRDEPAGEHEARRLADVVGVRLERDPEQGDRLAAEAAELLLELPDHAPLLQLVHLDHGVQELEVVAGVGRQLLQRQRVLRETTPAVADPGAEEARADPAVEPDALGHPDDVGAGRLADVRDLVDEADPRHQRRVRGELDHLGRGDVAADDRPVDPAVQLLDGVAVRVVEGADHDPVGLLEVADGGALGGELRVRDVADLLEAALVEPVAHLGARADRHGALHHHHGAPLEAAELVDDGPDGGEVGIARVGRRRADGDVEELGAVDGLGDVERVGQPLGVPAQQLLEPWLVDRHLARAQLLDPLGDDVADDDVVPELGEARAGDETDVAGAEDSHSAHGR